MKSIKSRQWKLSGYIKRYAVYEKQNWIEKLNQFDQVYCENKRQVGIILTERTMKTRDRQESVWPFSYFFQSLSGDKKKSSGYAVLL